jgi:mono/diheme cytochrome c family protein
MMKKSSLGTAILVAMVVAAACGTAGDKQHDIAEISNDSLIRRGAYLVNVMGCHDCHTPKKMTPQGPAPDMDRMLSGHPAEVPVFSYDTSTTKNWVLFNMTGTATVGPWGTTFSANLTSDETGIGAWTEEQFKKALKEGKLKGLEGTRPLLPPMPWQNYKDIKDEDVKAIFAFLKSTKPVKNQVPQPVSPQDLAKVAM